MAQNKIRLADLFRYYKALPHQMAAVNELEEAINKANPHILGRDQGWFKTWSVSGKQTSFPNSSPHSGHWSPATANTYLAAIISLVSRAMAPPLKPKSSSTISG
jgi:hypothetical protein